MMEVMEFDHLYLQLPEYKQKITKDLLCERTFNYKYKPWIHTYHNKTHGWNFRQVAQQLQCKMT